VQNLIFLWVVFIIFLPAYLEGADGNDDVGSGSMIDIKKTRVQLEEHLKILTVDIGERSVRSLENLKQTEEYITSFYKNIGLPAQLESYAYHDLNVANVAADISFGVNPSRRYILGAHYDSVSGTVGADDNASAIAVQLETARHLQALAGSEELDLAVRFVSFALEEPPVYGTRYMGSRVYAKKARAEEERIDGMICLEMVGYACHEPGCQHYPFPLMFFGYPPEGNFIGIVGNFKSGGLMQSLVKQFKKNRELPVVKLRVPFSGWILPAVRLSDHASFWDKGFKAVMVTDSAFFRNPYYHTAADTMEKLDYGFMAELVESLVVFFSSHRK
jgi:hypothetical protein